jgi:hypothetical protein
MTLADTIARIEGRGVELPETSSAFSMVAMREGLHAYIPNEALRIVSTELLAALDEATAIADAMETFIDSCTYHIKDGLAVVYEGPRAKRGES